MNKLIVLLLMLLMAGAGVCEDSLWMPNEKEEVRLSQKYTGIITFSIELSTSYTKNIYVIDSIPEERIRQEFLNKTVGELLKDGVDILKYDKIRTTRIPLKSPRKKAN